MSVCWNISYVLRIIRGKVLHVWGIRILFDENRKPDSFANCVPINCRKDDCVKWGTALQRSMLPLLNLFFCLALLNGIRCKILTFFHVSQHQNRETPSQMDYYRSSVALSVNEQNFPLIIELCDLVEQLLAATIDNLLFRFDML